MSVGMTNGRTIKRVILTTGGTGGHVFPALAVAEEIRRRFPEAEFLFVGGTYGPERAMVERAGIAFEGLPVRGVLGRGLRSIGAAFGIAAGVLRAIRIIGRFRPDAVVGFGGYAAFAACMAAKLREVPVAVHEQNSVPGLANRLIGKFADRVLISLPDEREMFLTRKTTLTGNPVRQAILALRDKKNDARKGGHAPRLLVVGGSLGAKALNEAMMAMLPALKEAGIDVHHQTGKADYDRVVKEYAQYGMVGDGHIVAPFIDDMAEAYAQADLVLCRAGATTIAELTAAGKPALFVPFPSATHNHQVANARYLEQRGAAAVVEEKDIPQTDLASLVIGLLKDRDALHAMSMAARREGRPEAAAAVVSGIMDILAKKPLKSWVKE